MSSPSQASRRASLLLERSLWVVSVFMSQYHGFGHTFMIFFTRLNISCENFKHCILISFLYKSSFGNSSNFVCSPKLENTFFRYRYFYLLCSNHFFFIIFLCPAMDWSWRCIATIKYLEGTQNANISSVSAINFENSYHKLSHCNGRRR